MNLEKDAIYFKISLKSCKVREGIFECTSEDILHFSRHWGNVGTYQGRRGVGISVS